MNNEDQNNIELPKENPEIKETTQNVDDSQNIQVTPDQNELTKILSETPAPKQEVTPSNEEVAKVETSAEPAVAETPVSNVAPEVAPQQNAEQVSQPNVAPAPVQQVQQTPAPAQVVQQASNINDNSTTIGTIKPDKQKSPVTMLVLFVLLLGFLMFMPQAVSFINDHFGTVLSVFEGGDEIQSSTSDSGSNNNGNGETGNQGEKLHTDLYDLVATTKIPFDKLEFTGFTKTDTDGNKISFTIRNTGMAPYTTIKKLFLDYYNDSNTFIGRSYIESFKEISGGATSEFNVDVDNNIYQKATKLEVVLKSEDEYDEVTLNNNTLTCVKGGQTLTYGFTDNKLDALKDVYVYTKTGDNVKYNLDLITAKSKNDNLDLIPGVTGVFTENENGYVSSVTVNYSVVDYSQISSDTNYYIKGTDPKVISFEMNAKGYTCR